MFIDALASKSRLAADAIKVSPSPESEPVPASTTLRGDASAWRGLRRVLAIRLDHLSGVLMSTPALAAVRHGLPGVELTLLTSPAAAAAAPHLPVVDRVMTFDAPWTDRGASTTAAGPGGGEGALVNSLAERDFQAALIFTDCTQSALPTALLCRMAGIPLRAAHSREDAHGLLTDWLPDTDHIVPGSAQPRGVRHEVLRQLALTTALGLPESGDALRFMVLQADRERVAAQLRAEGVDMNRPYAVVQPGASAPSRRWPAPQFGAVARALADSGCAVVFTGDTADIPLAEQALRSACDGAALRLPAVSLAGRQSCGELAALIEGAKLVLAHNSVAAQLAAAVGTPVVELHALTHAQNTPWRVPAIVLNHDVPCRWCQTHECPQAHHDCLHRVTPEEVMRAAFQLMGAASSGLHAR